MQRRTGKTVMRAAAVAVASVLLTGCFTVEATFTIKDDATADIEYLVLIDTEQLQEFAGLLGEETGALDELSGDALLEEFTGDEDPCGGLTDELTDYEISTRQIDEDGNVGVGCTVSSVPIAELVSLGDDTSSFSIEQDAEGTRFDAVLEGVDEIAGDPDETGAMTEMLGVGLDDLFTIKFIVTAPGSLGENNASSTDGSTATWDIKPDSDFVTDGNATMTAEWTPGGGGSGSSIWIIVAIIAAIAAIAAVAIVLLRRSKNSTSDTADTSETGPAPDTMMAPPGPAGMAPPVEATPPPEPGTPPSPPTASEPPTAPPSAPPTAPTSTTPPPPPPPS
ncbi:MAG TPA: hypothetical protein VLN74_16155 [Ilumatobacteraceae bacterium]|nr:hypothetical protein [Ilumatobacteraceae bacterium]